MDVENGVLFEETCADQLEGAKYDVEFWRYAYERAMDRMRALVFGAAESVQEGIKAWDNEQTRVMMAMQDWEADRFMQKTNDMQQKNDQFMVEIMAKMERKKKEAAAVEVK